MRNINPSRNLALTGLLFTILVQLSGCSSNPESAPGDAATRFYSLSALPPSTPANNALRIGVGPVEISRLLNRPQIVSRINNTEIVLSEFHQWGGSYKEELIQAISDNLSSILRTERIEQYPWKFEFKPAYQLRIDIEQLDGQPGKTITLKARWRLIKNDRELLVKRAVINTPVNGKSYNDYVKAQNKALITFSRQMAQQILKKP